MSNIKNLQMWKDICTDNRIYISKSLCGLKTTATYVPTNSIIDTKTIGFSPTDGNRLREILYGSHEKRMEAIGNFHPIAIPNGHYLLEIARSRDGMFLVLLLNQFLRLNYEPVTHAFIFEGDEANLVWRLFQ